jgi:hypothetical protein
MGFPNPNYKARTKSLQDTCLERDNGFPYNETNHLLYTPSLAASTIFLQSRIFQLQESSNILSLNVY